MIPVLVNFMMQSLGAVVAIRMIPGVVAPAPNSVRTLLLSGVTSNVATRALVSTASGIRMGVNSLRGVQSHPILRSTRSFVAEAFQNVAEAQVDGDAAVIEAVNQGTENVISTFASTMQQQRNAIIVCSVLPVGLLGLYILTKNPTLINNALKDIPSKEYISEVVKKELAERSPVVKPAILSLSTRQVLVVGGGGILLGVLMVILVLKLQETEKVKNQRVISGKV